MSDFFRNLAEDLKDEDTSIAADGMGSAEYTGTVDTGSYILNAVMSGSIYGGVPNNKITAFAGETTTGKTFFALAVVKQFLIDNPTGGVVYYDTEAAVTKDMMESRGIDTQRIILSEPQSIQQFRTHAVKVLDEYEKTAEGKRPPMMMVLDSLGILSSEKELADTAAGNDTRDMTKAQLIRGTFRVLTLKLAKLKVPMIVTNHVYEVIGSYIPMKEMGGGSGLKYAASTIAFLSKKKERDGKEVVGSIIKVKMFKSRLSKENQEVECLLNYDKGLDKYYGLTELAVQAGAWTTSANRVETAQGKAYPKAILKEPEKYFTQDVLDAVEGYVKNKFSYGGEVDDRTDDTEQSDSE
jgi:RecA/RadA recombinase